MAYTVKRGDTLNKIAARAGLSLRALLKLNPSIKNANLIFPGQKIVTKGKAKAKTPSTSGGKSYTVVKGDTLNKIAARAGISLRALLKLNPGIKNPDRIGIGLKVNLPGKKGTKTPAKPPAKPPTKDAGGGVKVEKDVPKEEDIAKDSVTDPDAEDPETALSILTSKEMKWFFDRSTGKWYVSYGLPNSSRTVVFEADPDQMDSLFGKGFRPTDFKFKTLKALIARPGVTFAGNISEVEGTGTFEGEVQRVISLALDDGVLPEWALEDGEALDILFVAASEEKSIEWIVNQLSKTKGFKRRFPQIQNFMAESNLTLIEAIEGFLEMEAGVNAALKATGQGEVDPATIGALLAAGHSLKTIQDTVTGFKRMEDFAPALDAFNLVLQRGGRPPIVSIQDMLDFVTGKSSSDIYDLYEASSITEAAVAAGLGDVFSVADSIDLASATEQNLATATAGMAKAAELLLRLRHEVDVNKFGLSVDELLDISLGRTPRSGRPQSEILENVNRAVLAAQGRLQKRAQPFGSFTDRGIPQTASLRNLRQTS